MHSNAFKLSDEQITSVIDRLVPLVASPEDQEFFRGVLRIKAEECTSSHFAYFVSKLLSKLEGIPEDKAAAEISGRLQQVS